MLCVVLLSTNNMASELFKSMNNYLSAKLKWSFCGGVCTDGAAAMTERPYDLTTPIKKIVLGRESTDCVIHRKFCFAEKYPSSFTVY